MRNQKHHLGIALLVFATLVACGASDGGTRGAEDAGAPQPDASSKGAVAPPPATAVDAAIEAAPPTGGGGSGHGAGTTEGDHSEGAD